MSDRPHTSVTWTDAVSTLPAPLREPRTVRVLGRDPWKHRRELAGTVAVIGQETGFADDLTAAETLNLWTDLHRLPPQRELLERVDLAHRATVRVGALSGGERRRLDLALAVATAPTVLLSTTVALLAAAVAAKLFRWQPSP